MATAAANAVANGIIIFASAGNLGLCEALSSPACLSDVVSVGAVFDAELTPYIYCISPASCTGYSHSACDPYGGRACHNFPNEADLVACWSNSADFLDLLAPGYETYTTGLNGGYNTAFGGTSASSPYGAGAAALLQSYRRDTTGGYYAPAQLKSMLIANGDPLTDGKNGVITPRINLGGGSVTPEDCDDGIDNDGDTDVDCDDTDCLIDDDGDTHPAPPCGEDCNDGNGGVWALPEEIPTLRWDGTETLRWDDMTAQAGTQIQYQIIRGLVSELPVGTGPSEICGGTRLQNWVTDSAPAPTNDSFYYLVRAVNQCPGRTGPYGYDSSGAERTSGACP